MPNAASSPNSSWILHRIRLWKTRPLKRRKSTWVRIVFQHRATRTRSSCHAHRYVERSPDYKIQIKKRFAGVTRSAIILFYRETGDDVMWLILTVGMESLTLWSACELCKPINRYQWSVSLSLWLLQTKLLIFGRTLEGNDPSGSENPLTPEVGKV